MVADEYAAPAVSTVTDPDLALREDSHSVRNRETGRRKEDLESSRAQLALRATEARFRLLVEGVRDYAIFMVGPRGHISSWNRGAERILGYRADEVIGNHMDLFQTKTDQELSLTVEQLRLAELFGRMEEEGWRVRKDGIPFWANVTISALFDDSGPIGFSVVIRDLTERREAEQSIRQRAEQLASIVAMQQRIAVTELDVGPAMEIILAELGALVEADGTALAVVEKDAIAYRLCTGVAAEHRDVVVDSVTSLSAQALRSGAWFRSDDAATDPRVNQLLRERLGCNSLVLIPLFYHGRGIGLLGIFYKEPGVIKEVHLDTLQLLSGQIAAELSDALSFEARARLVTERAAALEQLRESEVRFRALIENGSDCTEIVSPDMIVQYASPLCERILGFTPADMLHKSIIDFVHPEDANRVRGILGQVRDGDGKPTTLEFRKRHKSGEWRTVSASVMNLINEKAVAGLVVTSRDITEQAMLAAQLRQSQKMDAVGQLAGGIAHDFNNLLTVIKGNSELLTEDVAPGTAGFEEVIEIRKAADRAAALTRQLLGFSRKQLRHARPVDLNSIITELEPMLRRLIGEDIQTACVLEPHLPPILADTGQIHQIIINLAVNARDAMPQGGVLDIESRTRRVDAAYIKAHPGVQMPLGEYVQFSVTDGGTGMTDEVRAHLFEPFFTTKEAGKGTGLGLATVYGIVKQSNGFIWVETELGRGSRFEILFPSTADVGTQDATAVGSVDSAQGSETILLVEDEEPLRSLARRVLTRHGYSVLVARHGTDALDIAATFPKPIHLVLTDVVMPGMGGRELAEKIAGVLPDAKLLYMSGYTDDEILRRGLLDPAVTLLEKPFSTSELVSTVRRVLDAHIADS